SKCNGELLEIAENEKERVKDLVFDQTFDSYDQFWLCEECSSVYFQGGYWDNIQEFMQKVRILMASLDKDGQ
ncbi:MAG: Mut7-C RNAse domain-containing protein, partial [Candidatus Thorarchaeota archaeon]